MGRYATAETQGAATRDRGAPARPGGSALPDRRAPAWSGQATRDRRAAGAAGQARRRGGRAGRDRHSGAARSPAVEPLPHCWWSSALGVTWILDGLEVTLAGALAGALKESPTLRFTNAEVGHRQQRLSRAARCVGAHLLRLADRPARAQEAVLHHARRLSRRRRPRPRCRGTSGASRCSASSPAPASAANTPRSTRPSRS